MIAAGLGNIKFNSIRDPHDVRDLLFLPVLYTPPKDHVDLRAWGGKIKNQGSEGACVGHGFTEDREFISRRYEDKDLTLSPQFHYVECLISDGDFPNDVGSSPRTGCKVLTAMGACELALYPYVPGNIQTPSVEQIRNALQYRTGAYHRIASLKDAMLCLSDVRPWPITVGFPVYESFMTQQVADTGVMPIPKPGERLLGGHETLCLGYDVPTQMAIIQNSWGDAWGQRGYFMMPFEVFASPYTDLWMVHTGKPWLKGSQQ